MIEEWKDVKGYEGLYQVSSIGRIKSMSKKWVSGKGNIIKERGETILSDYIGNKGYPMKELWNNGESKLKTIHRLIAIAFIPNPDDLPMVNHKDGDKTNNKINNLEWCTGSYNLKHAVRLGLKTQYGETNPYNKLTEKEVLEIRSKYIPRSYSIYKLAKEYNVDKSTIHSIIKRNTWKYI